LGRGAGYRAQDRSRGGWLPYSLADAADASTTTWGYMTWGYGDREPLPYPWAYPQTWGSIRDAEVCPVTEGEQKTPAFPGV